MPDPQPERDPAAEMLAGALRTLNVAARLPGGAVVSPAQAEALLNALRGQDSGSDDSADLARIWVCPVCQVHRRADLPREHDDQHGRPCPGGRRAGPLSRESTDG